MYIYAKLSEVKLLTKECEEIIHLVQKKLKDYFTFDIRLIGSGYKKLVTQNGENGIFDLDYNLIIQRDKKDLIRNPKKIKELFRNAFDNVLKESYKNYKGASDSTSVLTIKCILNNSLKFSFDVAVLIENNDGSYSRLINDKKNGEQRYIWNRIPSSKKYREKLIAVKESGDWEKFKLRYLKHKNEHLRKRDGIKSFSIFLETLNEF